MPRSSDYDRSLAAQGEVKGGIAEQATRWIDVHRVSAHARFFSVFRFESGEELLGAISGIEIDPDAVAGSADLRTNGLGGALYWLLYVKGYLQFVEDGVVHDRNVYYVYMTRHFDADVHDPGLAALLSDPARARERVRRRFDDLELFRRYGGGLSIDLSRVDPVEVTIRDAPPIGAAVVFEFGSDHPTIGAVDGYHRIFAARLFGIDRLPCRFVEQEADAPVAAFERGMHQLVRFAIPYDACVAVLPYGDGDLDLDGRRRVLLVSPPNHEWRSSGELVEHFAAKIESARRRGAEFLLLPIPDESSTGARLLAHCDDRFRRVACQAGVAAVHFLAQPGEVTERDEVGPLPPPELTHLTIGIRDLSTFGGSGRAGLQSMEAILAKNGFRLEDFRSILDFGCGCGRLLRHLSGSSAELWGADYNPYLLDWCERNLPFARFVRTRLTPGLPFSDNMFDFVFAVAVFSHLDETLERRWLKELARVLRQGGVLLVTVHGLARVAELGPELQDRFMSGELVVIRPWLAGTNACAAYHPESYVRATFGAEMDLLDYVAGGAADVRQDAILLRKQA